MSFVGGLLGLFAGFSALSLVEVIYYFFIRIGINIFIQKNKVHPIVTPEVKNKNVRIVKEIVNEYLATSTIHGLQADGSKNWFSKYLFLNPNYLTYLTFCESLIGYFGL